MNPLPLLLLGGGALLLMAGKRKKTTSKKSEPTENGDRAPLPEPGEGEDLDEQDRVTPEPSPDIPPDSDPTPTPQPGPLEPTEPYGKPPIGPSGVGSCANSIYNRDPQYLQDIVASQKALTMFSEPEYFFYMRGDFQKKLYEYMLQRFNAMKNGQERRTVASVVLREALKHFNSGCKWEVPIDSLSQPEQLVWDGGRRLAVMAQVTAGIEDPGYSKLFQTGKRYAITRDSLDEPDPGFMGAQEKPSPGTRIEVLATDATQENAEHIIGEIVKLSGPNGEPNLFEVRIIDNFQGMDVEPRLRTKHGFKKGSNAYFSQQGPTGIYRLFPQGMV